MTELLSTSFDEIKHLVSHRAIEGETMVLNMGPQHPSTHGVLRLLLELDGETLINVIPDVGFLHTGIEKNMEAKTYMKAGSTATTGYATAVAASRAANVSRSRQSPRSVVSRRRNTQISPPSISTSRLPRSTTSRSPTPGRCSRCRKQGS